MTYPIPEFGHLSGVKVVHSCTSVAGPFAAAFFADNGAEVIHLESNKFWDNARGVSRLWWGKERRNQLEVGLEINNPDGKAIFKKLIRRADVFIESSKGGTYARWGLTDEVLWDWNPKLIIAHISGYGQTGEPGYIGRASYDMVGQVFSGYAMFNGPPDGEPQLAKPLVCDYITGLTACVGILQALYSAEKTGTGESIDITQFESVLNTQYWQIIEGLNGGAASVERFTGLDSMIVGDTFYKSKDDENVMLMISGAGSITKGLEILGLCDDKNLAGQNLIRRDNPSADIFLSRMREFCAEHTAEELETIFSEKSVPCLKMVNYHDMLTQPHYVARKSIVEHYSPFAGKVIKMPSPTPRFTNNPQQIWRGGASHGADNNLVLHDLLGIPEEEIQELIEKGIVGSLDI